MGLLWQLAILSVQGLYTMAFITIKDNWFEQEQGELAVAVDAADGITFTDNTWHFSSSIQLQICKFTERDHIWKQMQIIQ